MQSHEERETLTSTRQADKGEIERLRANLSIALDALHDIGGRDILRASEIAWTAIEKIEGDEEVAGEAMERLRQPENQPPYVGLAARPAQEP